MKSKIDLVLQKIPIDESMSDEAGNLSWRIRDLALFSVASWLWCQVSSPLDASSLIRKVEGLDPDSRFRFSQSLKLRTVGSLLKADYKTQLINQIQLDTLGPESNQAHSHGQGIRCHSWWFQVVHPQRLT